MLGGWNCCTKYSLNYRGCTAVLPIWEEYRLKQKSRIRVIWCILFVVYLAVLIYLLLFAKLMGREQIGRTYSYNLELFKEIKRFFKQYGNTWDSFRFIKSRRECDWFYAAWLFASTCFFQGTRNCFHDIDFIYYNFDCRNMPACQLYRKL